MLKGISPLLGPDLLALLCRMGHGDEIVLADAHFPGERVGLRVVRADGLRIADLLDAILPLLELDAKGGSPTVMMAADGTDVLDPTVEESFRRVILRHCPGAPSIARERAIRLLRASPEGLRGGDDRRDREIREHHPAERRAT